MATTAVKRGENQLVTTSKASIKALHKAGFVCYVGDDVIDAMKVQLAHQEAKYHHELAVKRDYKKRVKPSRTKRTTSTRMARPNKLNSMEC